MEPSRAAPAFPSSSPLFPSLLPLLLLLAALLPRPVQANADKVIFTAPVLPIDTLPILSTALPVSLATLADTYHRHHRDHDHDRNPEDEQEQEHDHGNDARYMYYSSHALRVRTNLSRVLDPSDLDAHPAWFLLSDLTPGQRYELRICWSALQPTSFTLDIFSPTTILNDPSLLRSLSDHAASTSSSSSSSTSNSNSNSNTNLDSHDRNTRHVQDNRSPSSAMLLRIKARADYFSHHTHLMTPPPPPVLVDIILDPYIYNILPRSLLPTAVYLLAVALVAWFMAQWIARSLMSIAASSTRNGLEQQKNEKKKQN